MVVSLRIFMSYRQAANSAAVHRQRNVVLLQLTNMARHINLNRVSVVILMIFFSLQTSFEQTRNDSLIVFVGEKIEVNYVESPRSVSDTIIEGNDTIVRISVRMDSEYLAKYKILQLIHGSYKSDTIEFTVFDHYGKPAFSKYQTVLLFVSDYDGKLYHEKYQYFDVYMTENGKWASPYSKEAYNHHFKDNITVKPEIIPFTDKVFYPIGKIPKSEIKEWFPEPYYKIEKKRAISIYGNYVEELFKLKQQTILKARGIY